MSLISDDAPLDAVDSTRMVLIVEFGENGPTSSQIKEELVPRLMFNYTELPTANGYDGKHPLAGYRGISLNKLRDISGISSEYLASVLDKNVSTINRWLKKPSIMSYPDVKKLINEFLQHAKWPDAFVSVYNELQKCVNADSGLFSNEWELDERRRIAGEISKDLENLDLGQLFAIQLTVQQFLKGSNEEVNS